MEQWDKNYYITSVAGASNGSALVIMSQGEWRTYIFPLFSSLHTVYSNFSKKIFEMVRYGNHNLVHHLGKC